jgi:hypothetical protein
MFKSILCIIALCFSHLAYSASCEGVYGDGSSAPPPRSVNLLAMELKDVLSLAKGKYSGRMYEDFDAAIGQRLSLPRAGSSSEVDPGDEVVTRYRFQTVKSLLLRTVSSADAIVQIKEHAYPIKLNYLEKARSDRGQSTVNVLDIKSKISVRTIPNARGLWNDIIADAIEHIRGGSPILNRWHNDLPAILNENAGSDAWVAGALSVALERPVTKTEVDAVRFHLRMFEHEAGNDGVLPAGPGNYLIHQFEQVYSAIADAGFTRKEMELIERSEILKGLPIQANFKAIEARSQEFKKQQEIADVLVLAYTVEDTPGLKRTLLEFLHKKAISTTDLKNLIGSRSAASGQLWARVRDALEYTEFINHYIYYWENFMFAMGMNPMQNLRKFPVNIRQRMWQYFAEQGGVNNFQFSAPQEEAQTVYTNADIDAANEKVLKIMASDQIGQAFKDTLQLYIIVNQKLKVPHSQSYPESVEKLSAIVELED